MMRSSRTMRAAALGGLLLVAGGAQAGEMKGMKMHRAAAGTPADRAFAASMRSMMRGMDVTPTGHPDRDFVDMMIPHHQGAIDMARVELRYGRDPMLRKLARGIVKAQEREIAEMRAWRAGHAR